MSVWTGLRDYSITIGPLGPLALISHRLSGYPRTIRVTPPGYQHPVTLRLRTTDNSTYRSVLLGDEYACAVVEQPGLIVDAGANIGMAAVYFAHHYPDARIVAIEPHPENFRMLCLNAAPYPQITPIQAALWTEDGTIRLSDPGAGAWGYRVDREGLEVAAISVPTLIDHFGPIDLFKVDIEGAEREVFTDPSWLSAVRCLAIETHGPDCERIVSTALRGWPAMRQGETSVYHQLP